MGKNNTPDYGEIILAMVITLRYVTHMYDSYYVITHRKLKDKQILKILNGKI